MDSTLRELERRWQETGGQEALQAYCRGLRRTGMTHLEITDGWPEPVVGNFWPNVTYKGMDAIELLMALDDLRRPQMHNEDRYDDSQECYMGYIPSEDFIVVGWDCWGTSDEDNSWWDEDEEETYGGDSSTFYGYAEVLNLRDATSVSEIDNYPHPIERFECLDGFYTRRTKPLFEQIKDKYPDLIGLRYD